MNGDDSGVPSDDMGSTRAPWRPVWCGCTDRTHEHHKERAVCELDVFVDDLCRECVRLVKGSTSA